MPPKKSVHSHSLSPLPQATTSLGISFLLTMIAWDESAACQSSSQTRADKISVDGLRSSRSWENRDVEILFDWSFYDRGRIRTRTKGTRKVPWLTSRDSQNCGSRIMKKSLRNTSFCFRSSWCTTSRLRNQRRASSTGLLFERAGAFASPLCLPAN